MTKKAEKGPGTQGGIGPDTGLATALAPLVAGMSATRASLLDWVHGLGVVALQEVFAAEAESVAGPKGQHQAARTHHHWGTTATELTFGGRRSRRAVGRDITHRRTAQPGSGRSAGTPAARSRRVDRASLRLAYQSVR